MEIEETVKRLDSIDRLQMTYPILKKRSLVAKVLNALDTRETKVMVFPATIIGMYLIEAVEEQRIK